MPRFTCAQSRSGGAVALLILSSIPAAARGEDPPPTVLPSAPLERIVLRVTDDWISSRLDERKIDRVSPVDHIVLGTRVIGQARTVGTGHLVLHENSDIARFDM